jgi:hypothetical protein
VKLIRFTRGSRKHRVGRKSAYHVIAMTAATITTEPATGDTTLSGVGKDVVESSRSWRSTSPTATSSST